MYPTFSQDQNERLRVKNEIVFDSYQYTSKRKLSS